jgi:hypothetical protein
MSATKLQSERKSKRTNRLSGTSILPLFMNGIFPVVVVVNGCIVNSIVKNQVSSINISLFF